VPQHIISRTIAAPVTVEGVGIHTGQTARVALLPASPGAGISFRKAGQSIPAIAANVTDTSRCTVLGTSGTTVSTVEHLLSALVGLGVTDVVVEVDGAEIPVGDGSAQVWVDALRRAGMREETTAGARLPTALHEPLLVAGKGGAFIAAYPADSFRTTFVIAFDHPLVGTQAARFEPARGDDYARDIAPARTFGFIEEVEALRAAGLARGGSLDNAIVIYPDRYSAPLRFDNELARHKLLDLIGDLSLSVAGALPAADIIAVKSSHRLNVAFAAQLADRLRRDAGAPAKADRG
jgi:UDP-3-O-[3-hydroxymyristoyl] N-acetylglucosamine deacetylase